MSGVAILCIIFERTHSLRQAGTGKSSLAAHFMDAACRRGERCVYFAFAKSPSQNTRDMRLIGNDLARGEQAGVLRFHAM
ncbi:MAG: hypothetical protein LC737_08800 [Chloroflexi bacterium]|nr:hypothetical protein [Chloroflexota bacterium]